MGYIFMTADQLSRAIAAAPTNTRFDFTFDQSEDDFYYSEPWGWHGAKIINIFDENDSILAIGHYGGGHTKTYDIDVWEEKRREEIIKECLQEYSYEDEECGHFISLFCVEITEQNKQYIEGVI